MVTLERFCTIMLRLIAFVVTFTATIVMVTTHETVTFGEVSYEIKYSDVPAFIFFVIANPIVCLYSLMVCFLPAESLLWKSVVPLDVVLTLLLLSTVSASSAIGQVGKQGISSAYWLPVCGHVSRFCDQIAGAIVCAAVGVFAYILLVLYSINKALDPLLLHNA